MTNYAAAALLALGLAGSSLFNAPATAQSDQSRTDGGKVTEMTAGWPKVARKAADAMIKKYGSPSEATENMFVWYNNGPWKRTIVYKEEADHEFPMPHKDVLEQFVAYEVPSDKFDELAAYDGSVIVERTKGEISARCDKEGANFLALNLADDIVTGEKSVEEARQAYAEAIQAFMAGNPPDSMKGLTFNVNRDYSGDPGKTIIDNAATGASSGESGSSSAR
ncbi:MAG: hypothetical protein KJ587_11795 [Alphaproteobacteria bacterium]|nr:hypothetical protein [Alphaproteobacteria bacterium]